MFHLVLLVVPALAQGQARAAAVYHVIQVIGDLVGLAAGSRDGYPLSPCIVQERR